MTVVGVYSLVPSVHTCPWYIKEYSTVSYMYSGVGYIGEDICLVWLHGVITTSQRLFAPSYILYNTCNTAIRDTPPCYMHAASPIGV